MSGTVLVADVGATHARFAIGREARVVLAPAVLSTAAHETSAALLRAALAALQVRPSAACLAIAGPVQAGRGRITNGGMRFDAAEAERVLGCPVTLINDFHALARALPALDELQQLGGSEPLPGVKAVLGPGSGLGMGLLAPASGGGWQVLASEGGHADLAPGSPLESELLTLLQQAHRHVSWETVLSGPGLVRLYQAMCQLWGIPAGALSAEQISRQGLDAAEPVCHQTLDVFFALLGAAAGNLALTACAVGGVYLGGGIVPGLAGFAAASPLRRRFDERGVMTPLVEAIPLYLVLDAHPGLTGALACLTDP